jgi:cell division protein FtsB
MSEGGKSPRATHRPAHRALRIEPGDRASRVRFTSRAIALGVVVLTLLVAGIYPLRTFLAERARIASLEQRAHELKHDNASLEQTIARLHDPAYLERLARECLGMVRPGEVSFLIVPSDRAGRPTGC